MLLKRRQTTIVKEVSVPVHGQENYLTVQQRDDFSDTIQPLATLLLLYLENRNGHDLASSLLLLHRNSIFIKTSQH